MIEAIHSAIYNAFIIEERWQLWLIGLQNTLTITFFALIIGLLIGITIAIIRVSKDSMVNPPAFLIILNRLVSIYVSVIRGIPMLVQLLVWAFIILAGNRNGIIIGSLAFGFNSGAYVSEIFRAGIQSVDKGQMEAGRSLGLSYPQSMFKIVLPQAIKNCLPAFGNEFISLLKETSIAGMAGIMDITQASNSIRSRTFDATTLIFVAIVYLILVIILEQLVKLMERKLAKSDKRGFKAVKSIKRKELRNND